MTDLKLIDELLCEIKESVTLACDGHRRLTWSDIETWTSVTARAMHRLREAWQHGEMEAITLSLAQYFEVEKAAPRVEESEKSA